MARKVILLVNLGSPDEPTPRAVGRYLREFLMDENVIDRPWWLRWFLVNLLIVPLRRKKSAHAYQRIWTEQGSPLKVHTAELAKALQREVGGEWRVDWAMRYGRPGLRDNLTVLASEQPDELVVIPLYPHLAKSSWGTVADMVARFRPQLRGQVRLVMPFFNAPEYLAALTNHLGRHLKFAPGDHLLFSYHGLPERHVKEAAQAAACLRQADCCAALDATNAACYRAQCFATSREVARGLGLGAGDWSVAFQSRLGREPWIGPELSAVLKDLRQRRGVRRVWVTSPSFVADCLETLEEIGINAKADFAAAGGELILIPALNSDPVWVKNLAKGASFT